MTPSPGINYNFVAGAYLVCSLILGVLVTLDKVMFSVQFIPVYSLAFKPSSFELPGYRML